MTDLKTTTNLGATGNTPEKKEKKGAGFIILIILAILLAGGNGLFFWMNQELEKDKTALTVERDSLTVLKNNLIIELDATIDSLEAMMSENDSLNAMIVKNIAEIQSLKGSVAHWKGKAFEYKKRAEVYIAQTERLMAQVEQWQAKEQRWISDSTNIATVNETTQQQLNTEIDFLTDKYELASVIKCKTVEVQGIFEKKGKVKVLTKAKKVQRLEITCALEENKVRESGTTEMILKITGPGGATMCADAAQLFTPNNTEMEEKYSLMKEFDYNNSEKDLTFIWTQESPFGAGPYKVEVYHEGHIVGDGDITLK